MMQTVLPAGTRPTSVVGFGCSSLSGGSSRRRSIDLVHAAFDAGIRHFDVAPPYGMGTAEGVLGEALQGRRGLATLTTKVGITPAKHGMLVMRARSLAAPLRKLVPALTRKVGASAYKGLTTKVPLDPAFLEASVAESLRRLQTDHLDLLLLHEVTPDKLTDEVVSYVDSLRERGLIRALGIGTSYEDTLSIRAAYPGFFDVWQYSWSVLDRHQEPVQNFTITHRSIQRAFGPLRNWMREDASRLRRLSETTRFDLGTEDNLGKVLVAAAIAQNPQGITLVSSRQKHRILDHARLMQDVGILAAGSRFADALAGEPDFQDLQRNFASMRA